MRTNWHKALLVSFVLITSSLAGCLNNDDDDDEKLDGKYGTVMVSTYHVEQMVSAIAGDTVNVEMMSQNNIPVHDYEPSLEDIVRLGEADLFLYHGLGLEPWVESTLSTMGSDAPVFGSTHAMPTGEVDLDYESMLISDLCELLTAGPNENLYLAHMDDELNEFHAEKVAHSLEAAEHEEDGHGDDHGDDEHGDDEHGDDEHGDDEHGDDDHGDHGDHEGHNHAEAEETITNPEGCPTDSVIQIFHLEEGEYVIEFESEHHDEEFNLAVLKMLGGHAHHDHGDHDDHGDEEMVCYDMSTHTIDESHTSEEDCESAGLTWTASDSGPDDHGDEDGHAECHNTSTHENYESTEEDCEAAGHVWMEEDDHGEDGHGECHNTSTHENYESTEEDCEAAGHVWMEEDDHGEDDHISPEHALEMFDTNNDSSLSWEEFWEGWMSQDDDHGDEHNDLDEAMEEYMANMLSTMFNESDSNSDTLLNLEELENFLESIEGIEDELDSATSEIMISVFDEDEDGQLSMDEFTELMESMEDDHGDNDRNDLNGDGDDGDDDHGEINETEMAELMFSMLDANEDGFLSGSELDMMMDMGEEEHDEDVMGYATIHIEVEGEYGFAHSTELEMFILMGEDGHDHDGHDEDREEDMVCYDIDTHVILEDYDNQMDCEYAGYMWVSSDSGDEHTGDNSWTFERGMEDCDSDNDTMVSYEELVACIDEDLANDGFGDMSASDVRADMMFDMSDMDNDTFLNESELSYLNSMYSSDEEGHDEEGHDEELAYDPHSWLDPLAFKVQVDIVLQHLIDVFPEGEDTFTANAEKFKSELDELHIGFDAKLNDGVCTDKTVVANHNAYSYMAYRYDVEFLTVHGLDPEGEPSPEDVAKVVEHINEEGITVLFVEEYTDQSSIQSIVDETGVSIKILYTMEMAPSDTDDDYLTMMQKNLDNLASGMGC